MPIQEQVSPANQNMKTWMIKCSCCKSCKSMIPFLTKKGGLRRFARGHGITKP